MTTTTVPVTIPTGVGRRSPTEASPSTSVVYRQQRHRRRSDRRRHHCWLSRRPGQGRLLRPHGRAGSRWRRARCRRRRTHPRRHGPWRASHRQPAWLPWPRSPIWFLQIPNGPGDLGEVADPIDPLTHPRAGGHHLARRIPWESRAMCEIRSYAGAIRTVGSVGCVEDQRNSWRGRRRCRWPR